MDVWTMISGERQSLADAMDGLSLAEWDKPSLCVTWSVREVLAHLTASALMTPGKFFKKFASSGFNFDKMTERDVASLVNLNSDGELLAVFKSRISTTNGPPGPKMAMLGEAVVHSEDIFRALGAYHEHPTEHLLAVADFYKGSSLIVGAKKRIAGLSLSATDADWKTGEGPQVSGPLIALIMAMTGRSKPLEDLSGDGVASLRGRS